MAATDHIGRLPSLDLCDSWSMDTQRLSVWFAEVVEFGAETVFITEAVCGDDDDSCCPC